MEHKALLINHRLESWVYADAADRTGATGFSSSDIGRIAYQTDTGEYWRLMSITPTWQATGLHVPGYYNSGLVTPAGVTGTTPKMQGLAGTITPLFSGKIFVIASGSMSNPTSGGGASARLFYGTGAPPANGDAATGNVLGATAAMLNEDPNLYVPFCCSGIVTGLTLGTVYWLDLQLNTQIAAVTATIAVNLSAHEF